MKAVLLQGGAYRCATDCPAPTAPAGEALIRVALAGVCDTDVQLAAGYMAFEGVPGHEFVGTVVEGPAPWPGRRVVGEINCGCGSCDDCRAGRPTHCRTRTVLGIAGRGGAFAEYLVLPAANLHEVPAGVGDEQAVFAEPLAAAVNVVERVHVSPTDRVAVVGDGKLGLLVAQVLSLTGARVVVVGHHPGRAERLARMGRPLPIVGPAAAPDAGFDVVVECTGAADGLTHALRYVRARGTVVLKTTVADPYNLDLAPVVVNEVTVAGNRCGPFAPALELLARRLVDPAPLVEEVHALEDVPALLARGAPGLKHLVRFA